MFLCSSLRFCLYDCRSIKDAKTSVDIADNLAHLKNFVGVTGKMTIDRIITLLKQLLWLKEIMVKRFQRKPLKLKNNLLSILKNELESLVKYVFEQLPQQLVNGIILGSIYALLALGYTMVYGIIKLINFAHGDIYMMGAFVGYYAINSLGMNFWLPLSSLCLSVRF